MVQNKTISVVTGASGFVGSHLVDLLLAKGHHVKCLIRKTSNLRWLKDKPVEIIDCGLYDKEALKKELKDIDYLFHVAGIVKAKDWEGYYKGNVETTKNLLEVVKEVNHSIKRVILISSLTACGPSLDGKPVTEETDPHPITRYGKSKYEEEKLAKQFMTSIPITIIMPHAVYGERDTEIYQYFKMYKAGLLPLIGFGQKNLNLIHVSDLVEGIYLASLSDKAAGQKYFLASEEIYDWPGIGEAISKAFGKKAFTIRLPHSVVYTVAVFAQFFSMFSKNAATFNIEKARDWVQKDWTCDVSKAINDLGYRQKVSLDEGIKRSIDWYKEMKWL
jgi:dihydroflavonol-4-reductase